MNKSEDIYLIANDRLTEYYRIALEVLKLESRLQIISKADIKLAIPKAHVSLLNTLHA